MIPALPEVEAYAARILAWVDRQERASAYQERPYLAADRRRVERDVEGLRDHDGWHWCSPGRLGSVLWREGCEDARRYWTDLTEIGSLYGQPWEDVPTIDLFLPPVGEVQP